MAHLVLGVAAETFDMDTAVFTPQEISTALGAMWATTSQPNEVQARLVRIVGMLHGLAVDPAGLPVPTPAQTAAIITDPQRRERLLQLVAAIAWLGSPRSPAAEQAVEALAAALGISAAAESDCGLIARMARARRS